MQCQCSGMSTGKAPRHGARKSGSLQAAAVPVDSCAAVGVSQASRKVPGRQQPSKLQTDRPSRRLSWLLLTSLLGVVLLAICAASPVQAWLSDAVNRWHHSPSDSRPTSERACLRSLLEIWAPLVHTSKHCIPIGLLSAPSCLLLVSAHEPLQGACYAGAVVSLEHVLLELTACLLLGWPPR